LRGSALITDGDTVKSVADIQRFIDKFYVVHNMSPKDTRELKVCTNLLDIELSKIG
jgi:hypothetical protein